MASVFSHAVAACAIGQAAPDHQRSDWRFWYLAVLCAVFPDIDVAGFAFGVRYDSLWGHRGITHSLLFAGVAGALAAARLRPRWNKDGLTLAAILIVVAASHGVLDAFTNGGLGVAFFSPFDRTRYFFPWTPIEVSPIGVAFFSLRGLEVLKNEIAWIWMPSLAAGFFLRRFSGRSNPASR
ncbi:MAG TPA: metal-dependent hydrolase [Candidatus Binatia bacterium]|jgi:inner membrane protein